MNAGWLRFNPDVGFICWLLQFVGLNSMRQTTLQAKQTNQQIQTHPDETITANALTWN